MPQTFSVRQSCFPVGTRRGLRRLDVVREISKCLLGEAFFEACLRALQHVGHRTLDVAANGAT